MRPEWVRFDFKVINCLHVVMSKSSRPLIELLQVLEGEARKLGLTSSEWAARAGIRQETLSRLRRRPSCDLQTIDALARAVGFAVHVGPVAAAGASPDGLFPMKLTRDAEEKLVELCASGTLDPDAWVRAGPRFFMAGVATMLASVPGLERRDLLELAEALHAGSTRVEVFASWLDRSPLKPSRFLPAVLQRVRRAA